MKTKNGITLVALIITIIVMLIIVGVSVAIVIKSDILFVAQKSAFLTMMSRYKEHVDIYIMKYKIQQSAGQQVDLSQINAGATSLTPQMPITNIIAEGIKEGYENKIAIEAGELYYVPTDNSAKEQREVKWCFELDIKVKGYASKEEYEILTAPVSKGEYTLKDGIYVNSPNLIGFSKTNTYYVTYDEDGENEAIGNLITTAEPEGWYNYNTDSKIWANVVTIDEEKVAYWVWIPRYAYKITYYTDSNLTTLSAEDGKTITGYGKVDIKFLSTDNICKEYNAGTDKTTETPYSSLEGYIIPEAFIGKDGKPLAGYWVSKYELGVNNIFTFNIEKLINGDIKVTKVNTDLNANYEIYLDGELKHTGKGEYTFSGLEENREYEITIKQKDELLGIERSITRKVTTTIYKGPLNSVPTAEPNLTGFNPESTYYVYYDEDGTERIGNLISDEKPDKWYDYENKIWANIVTLSEPLEEGEDISTTTKNVAYWVWIPRYEYKAIDTSTESDYVSGDTKLSEIALINFISTDIDTPEEQIPGFQIPEAFTGKNGEPLSGYWVSKYEIGEPNTTTE